MTEKGHKPGGVECQWLDLQALTQYACVSNRTLRTWINSAHDPLPASRIGGKILVRRRDFDGWLEAHRLTTADRVNAIVEQLVTELT